MRLTRLLLAAFGLAAAVRAAPVEGTAQVLSQANFAAKTATGTWVVKHYSPRCKHCRAFQPKWEKVVGERAAGLAARSVYFGEVDCLDNEKLCEANKAESWPAVVVFRGGVRVADLVGDSSEEDLA
ncbi:hypothetical protein IWQ56_002493, partial [Coemansia nantahalensis]